jgi:hypothetical protein
VKERFTDLLVRRSYDRKADGMSHARARRVVRAVECHRVAEDHSAAAQGLCERRVRRDALALESIGFSEDDVERHDGRAELAQPLHQLANHVAAPGPLADAGEAPFVDIDDDDALARGREGIERSSRS